MKAEDQIVAIAEACGWKHRLATVDNPIERGGFRLPNAFGPSVEAWWHEADPEYTGVYGAPPRYLTDLNAMQVAQLTLTPTQQRIFGMELGDILVDMMRCNGWIRGNEVRAECWLWNATAAQRAEALLRTIGKWIDDGTWWCNTHRREATHVRADGDHCCQPHQGGIMIPCCAVFAPMTVEYS